MCYENANGESNTKEGSKEKGTRTSAHLVSVLVEQTWSFLAFKRRSLLVEKSCRTVYWVLSFYFTVVGSEGFLLCI